jgi:hypothetical protein
VQPAVARMSRAALTFDTHGLPHGDPGLRDRLGLPPATSLDEVLSQSVSL